MFTPGQDNNKITQNLFCGFVAYIEDTVCKKLNKIGQCCLQQSQKQSTDSYTGLPLPIIVDDQCRGPNVKEKDHIAG